MKTVLDNENKIIETSKVVDSLWDILREHNCATKLKAQRIIVLHKEDISKAVKQFINN